AGAEAIVEDSFVIPAEPQVQRQLRGDGPVVLGENGTAIVAWFGLKILGRARRGVGVAEQKVGEGIAGVPTVESEAAARRGGILEVESGYALVLAAKLHGVLSADPAQIIVDLVITLAVARAGLIEESGNTGDGDGRLPAHTW